MNPVIDEKVKIQRKLSMEAGSVSAYIKMMQKNMDDVEERFGIVLNRPMKENQEFRTRRWRSTITAGAVIVPQL